MKRAFWIYLLIFAIGIIVVAIPDNDEPLVVLSESHGPSPTDLIGLVLALSSWTSMLTYSVRRWRTIVQRLGGQLTAVCAGATFLGFLGIAGSIRSDNNFWIAGAVLAFVAQLVPMIVAFRESSD